MTKKLNKNQLSNIIGGSGGFGGFSWASAIYHVVKSGYVHRADVRRGYYSSPFHD